MSKWTKVWTSWKMRWRRFARRNPQLLRQFQSDAGLILDESGKVSAMTVAAPPLAKIPNYINGQWQDSTANDWQDVLNPATAEVLAKVALSHNAEVTRAIDAAATAYPAWRRTPPEDRIQPLFKLK